MLTRPITTSTTNPRPTCISTSTSVGTARPNDRPVAASISRKSTTTSMMRSAKMVPIVVENDTEALSLSR